MSTNANNKRDLRVSNKRQLSYKRAKADRCLKNDARFENDSPNESIEPRLEIDTFGDAKVVVVELCLQFMPLR